MIRRDERATRHACEVLLRVLVAVGRAVVHYQRPGKPCGRKLALLLICGEAGEVDPVPHLPGGGRRRRAYGRAGLGVARAYRERLVERVGRPLAVGDPESDLVATTRVGATGPGLGGVVVGAVPVEVPLVREGIALGVSGGGAVEAHRKRRRAPDGARGGARHGRLVGGKVLYATDGPADDVGVEEISSWPDLQIHRTRSPRHEGAAFGRVRRPVGTLLHNPDALAGVVGEEEGAVVAARVGAALVEGHASHRRAARSARLSRHHRVGVGVGVVGVGDGRRVGPHGYRVRGAAVVLRGVGGKPGVGVGPGGLGGEAEALVVGDVVAGVDELAHAG